MHTRLRFCPSLTNCFLENRHPPEAITTSRSGLRLELESHLAGGPHCRHSLRRRMRHEQLMPLATTRNQRKTTAATDSSIGWLHPEARIPRTRQSTVGRDLVDWNRGMGDAESGRLAASGRSRDYYDGYYYACAVNYEYVGALPEFAGEGDLSKIGSDSATVAAADFTAQLNRLHSSLLNSQGASLPAGAGPGTLGHFPAGATG